MSRPRGEKRPSRPQPTSDESGPTPATASAEPPLPRGSSRRGHESRAHPGQAPQLCAPSVANRHDFDLIQCGRRYRVRSGERSQKVDQLFAGWKRRYCADVTCGQAKRGAKTSSTCPPEGDRREIFDKKNVRCQLLHSFFTNHAQVFHNRASNGRFEPKPQSSGYNEPFQSDGSLC